jgi:hypothetical protein
MTACTGERKIDWPSKTLKLTSCCGNRKSNDYRSGRATQSSKEKASQLSVRRGATLGKFVSRLHLERDVF